MSIDHQPASERDSAARTNDRERLLDKPWVLLGLLFFVTLLLGLPLLWRSPSFSALGKTVITIVNLAYSAIVLWAFYLLMAWCYGRVTNALQSF